MRFLPVTLKSAVVFAVCAAAPMLPLLLAVMPLRELLGLLMQAMSRIADERRAARRRGGRAVECTGLENRQGCVDELTRVRRGARSAPKDGAAQRRRSRAQRAQSQPLRQKSGPCEANRPRSRRRNLRARSAIRFARRPDFWRPGVGGRARPRYIGFARLPGPAARAGRQSVRPRPLLVATSFCALGLKSPDWCCPPAHFVT